MALRSLWGQGRPTPAEPSPPTTSTTDPQSAPLRSDAIGTTPAPIEPPTPATPTPSPAINPPQVAELLQQVIDPEIGVNIVDLGLIYGIHLDAGTARIRMSLTTPGCPLSAYMEDNVDRVLSDAPGIGAVDLQIIWEPAWTPEMMSTRAKRELGWPV